MWLFVLSLSFFSILKATNIHADKPKDLCNNIVIVEGSIDLNSNERILICGSDKGGDGWKEVPQTQSVFHLRTILHNLGYLDPKFDFRDGKVFLRIGPRTIVEDLKVQGSGLVINPSKKRKIVGYPMMSDKLSEVETWADTTVKKQGYACPEIEVTGQAWNRTILIETDLKNKKMFSELGSTGLDGLHPTVLERYRPFEKGDVYDIRKTQIMTSRMMNDGLFQSAYFTTRCREEWADVELHTSTGKPKILRFGIGGSTEELPFIDISFRNTRLDNRASYFTTALHASPRVVSLSFGSEFYFFPSWPKSFLGPRFRVAREWEAAYESLSAKLGIDYGRKWDMWDIRFVGKWGPTYNYSKVLRGVGPDNIIYPSVEGSLSLMSHTYEFLIGEQYQGWLANFFYRALNKGIGSYVDVNRYELDLKYLWNIADLSPPLFVLGTRLEGAVVEINEGNEDVDRRLLPVDERLYLGGDNDLRGFPRQSINNHGLGYLTTLYFGMELRLIEELPYKLQPFFLFDAAKIGNRRYTLEKPVLTSHGLGLRWASPFGTLRGTIAQGRIYGGNESTDQYPEEWVFFVSFGQEF